jgi:hypothetical protein
MSDEQPEPTETDAERSVAPPERPRWVKISAVVVAVVIMLVLIILLVGGDHGPGRHIGT